MVEPISNIAPLREDLAGLVPDSFLLSTTFKRWIIQINLNKEWTQCLYQAQREPSILLASFTREYEAGLTLTLLMNDFYTKNKKELGEFIFHLLELYSKETKEDIDVNNICKDLEIINIPQKTINTIKGLNRKSEILEKDEATLTEEQKIREKEEEYKRLISYPNSEEAIRGYLEWYNSALLYLGDHYSIADPDFAKFKSLDNSGNGFTLYDNYKYIYGIYNLLMKNALKQIVGENQSKKKTPMVFISHASEDKEFVEALVDMLEGIGLNSNTLFCSSIEGYNIPLGENILDYLYALFQEHELFVIFVHTPNYYKSPMCLNEMGAAWVLKTNYRSILSKDMSFVDMKGVVTSNDISIKVDDDKNAPSRLTELKNKLTEMLELKPIDEIKWDRKRKNFLKIVNSL